MKFVNWIKKRRSRKSYEKNAQVCASNIYGLNGRCTNCSGKRDGIIIGNNSCLLGSIYVSKSGRIHIGDHFYLGPESFIGAANSVQIGNCVIISNNVYIYDNNNHPTSPKDRMTMSLEGFSNANWSWQNSANSPVTIEDNVWVGQHSTILKGVTIGKGSIVATRSVVTKDVPPFSIVAGNPAKVVKKIDNEED